MDEKNFQLFILFEKLFNINKKKLKIVFENHKGYVQEQNINFFLLLLIFKIILHGEYEYGKINAEEFEKITKFIENLNIKIDKNGKQKFDNEDFEKEILKIKEKLVENEIFSSVKKIISKTFNILFNIYKNEMYDEEGEYDFKNLLLSKLTNHIIVSQPKYLKFKYSGIKKDETAGFNIQFYGLDYAYYLNNFSFSLRSKKNNRPIMINWGVVNKKGLKGLEQSLKTFLYGNLPYNKKQSLIAGQIMKMVFLGKDDELKKQEELLNKIYEMGKNNVYKIIVKDVFQTKFILSNLIELFGVDLKKSGFDFYEILGVFEGLLKESEVFKAKINELKNLNIYIVGEYDFALDFKNFLSKIFGINEIVFEGKSFIFRDILNYFKDFTFYRETLLTNFKNNGLTKLYNFEVKIESEFIEEILKFINKKYRTELFKGFIKFLKEGFDFGFNEYVFNSYLTQVDLSNSLELLQDTFQKFLQLNGIKFDDVEITKINADILRIKKKIKNSINLKNINLFSIEKK